MRLSIFAYHVTRICLAQARDVFTLYTCEGVRVKIQVEDNGDDVLVDGKWAGNRQGAVKEYTRIVTAQVGETMGV